MDKITEKTYDLLKEEASRGAIITYGNLYDRIGIDARSPMDRKRASEILTKVNEASMAEKGVMIGAIVVLQEEQIPGKMFFVLAEELGKIEAGAEEEEKNSFWREECSRVYEAYGF